MPGGGDMIKYFLFLAGGGILYIGFDIISDRLVSDGISTCSGSCAQALIYVNQWKPLIPFVILICCTLWLWVQGLNAQEGGY